LRKLKIFFVTLICLLSSNIAYTLGVGDITVNSALNQPLDAEIKLFSVRPGESDNIRVTLGSLKDFANAGIERPLVVSFLKFKVVDKFIDELEGQLADQGVTIDLSPEARDKLGNRGYDSQNGARPLARVIQEYIKKPLAEELLFGRLSKGGRVNVGVADGDFTFDFVDGPPPKKTKKGKKRKTDEPGALEPVK